jgi:hypothetical protein
MRKLAFFGLESLEADFALLYPSIEASRKAGNGAARSACSFIDDNDMSRWIMLVSAALQMAWENLQKNPRELSFQLYGRLFVWRSDVVAVDTYLDSLERHAERPWLKSMSPFLQQVRHSCIASVNIGFQA